MTYRDSKQYNKITAVTITGPLTYLEAPVNDAYQVTGDVEAPLQLSYCALHVAPRQGLCKIGKGQSHQKHLAGAGREKKRKKKKDFTLICTIQYNTRVLNKGNEEPCFRLIIAMCDHVMLTCVRLLRTD